MVPDKWFALLRRKRQVVGVVAPTTMVPPTTSSSSNNNNTSNDKGKNKSKRKADVGEIQIQKSPAEFFAENQAIAGFDNLGKSLYTTIRELVENGLDACEAIDQLPDISVHVTEYSEAEFNQLNGIAGSPSKFQMQQQRKDQGLFEKKKAGRRSHSTTNDGDEPTESQGNNNNVPALGGDGEEGASEKQSSGSAAITKKRKKAPQDSYFHIAVQDNGCGMKHDAIPDLLGRVLSGSKYGVRQTRGKFGLGAKMALIWSKKSAGQPIRVVTAHRTCSQRNKSAAHGNSEDDVPTHVSTCILDIDIYKNEPRVLKHTRAVNNDGFVGTIFEVLVAGNWTTYKSRIVQYMQQLAIITPYARLELTYHNESDPKRNMKLHYDRRSEQMPPAAIAVKHHPASVNNLVIQQLVQVTRCKTLLKFLLTELSAVSPNLAKRLIAELAGSGVGVEESTSPAELSDKQITRLVQLLRQVQLFKAPDGSCLSPLGEYNLNLGIRKVLEPDLVATARDKPGAYEGHPFLVEAAVCLGGNKQMKEGITVVRFANRIPLLFEGGADVSTRVAQSKIRWSNYKIDHKKDKVGVFVSIVSTKIPFKGTSKEYIGDDATEIQQSVKRALQSCCQQLRVHLAKRNAIKEAKERTSRLNKYVPDVSRSLYGLLEGMRQRRAADEEENPSSRAVLGLPSPTKRIRLDESAAQRMIEKLNQGHITEETIKKSLHDAIVAQQGQEDDRTKNKEQGGSSFAVNGSRVAKPLYLVPLYNMDDPQYDILCPPNFLFRPLQPVTHVFLSAKGEN